MNAVDMLTDGQAARLVILDAQTIKQEKQRRQKSERRKARPNTIDGLANESDFCRQWKARGRDRCAELAQWKVKGGGATADRYGREYMRQLGKAGFDSLARKLGSRGKAAAQLVGCDKIA